MIPVNRPAITPIRPLAHAPGEEKMSALELPTELPDLDLNSSLKELPIHRKSLGLDCPGQVFFDALEADPLLPGTLLTDNGHFVGFLSRRRFLKHLSKLYGQELFLRRPLEVLFQYAQTNPLELKASMRIDKAARKALKRPSDMLYEPIVVRFGEDDYGLLEMHQLLIAQSKMHKMAVKRVRAQAREQIIQTEKMASLGTMMAGISHEIKNPTNFIAGNTTYLKQYIQDLFVLVDAYKQEVSERSPALHQLEEDIDLEFLRTDLSKLVDSMRVGADKLKEIVAGLQHVSYTGSRQHKASDLAGCLDSTVIVLNNRLKEGITVVRNYGKLPLVPCNPGQLSQVFLNLIGNSIDALIEERDRSRNAQLQELSPGDKLSLEKKSRILSGEESGWQPTVEITTSLRRGEDISLQGSRVAGEERDDEQGAGPEDGLLNGLLKGWWVSVVIADNGPGIPTNIQDRIFDTFFTTKAIGKGTGLGLAISHDIIAKGHQGYLRLESPRVAPKRIASERAVEEKPVGDDPQTGSLPGTLFEILLPLDEDEDEMGEMMDSENG